jgi:hypothetical protein
MPYTAVQRLGHKLDQVASGVVRRHAVLHQ